MCKIPLLVIVGPTASGKTALSVEIAREFNGEIVSADSMQIYKGMSVATAKPTKAEMKNVPHHLIDFLEVDEKYSVADYTALASKTIREISKRNKLPILVGGTGLYVDSLVNNIQFTEIDTDYELREKLTSQFEQIGAEKMLEKLSEFDRETAEKLNLGNKKRIIRAFEVYYLTGKTMSQLEIESRSVPSDFSSYIIGINFRDREKLYERINARVDLMLENGLLQEAEKYYSLPKAATSSQAIGYKELKPYFDGEITLEKAIDNLKLSTRHYAKRQLTWFGRNEKIKWFYFDDYSDTSEFLLEAKAYVKKVFENG